jgi:uncharacterized damage-inducible protein DinB
VADQHDGVVNAADIGELLRLVADTPGRLEALSRGLDDQRLQRRPSQSAWSANEILAHLRACADVWGGSIQAMIERDQPTLRYVSPRTWIRKTRHTSQPFAESLRAFTVQRGSLVRVLSALEPADWARGATFTGTTRGREQTILDYVRRLAAHELEHREQIEATLKQP